MEIPEKLVRFKFHILIAIILCIVVSTLVLVATRFVTVLAYFWPLLLSTALFLFAVLVFGKTSTPPAADKAGEGLLDYVAGQPDDDDHRHHHHHHVETPKPLDEHAVESSTTKSE
ncbi:hypothetical protein PanWU01x14_353270 [Parasponia andersonii]|uniref:Transmembrane protein n=1 Tax=Parasponia andersonii TaxID=3476 RepID=A0A2P5AA24_PARAD|nr:hypothetical protein PanWU01x14_353270 [Parasponia andersonii]